MTISAEPVECQTKKVDEKEQQMHMEAQKDASSKTLTAPIEDQGSTDKGEEKLREAMYALMQSCGYAITVKKVTRILAECQERVMDSSQNEVGDGKTSHQSTSSVLSLEEPRTSVTSQASKTEISTELSSNADTLLLSETTGKAESQDKNFKVKDRVFALWDDCYYPGTITAINQPTDMCTIKFDDGVTNSTNIGYVIPVCVLGTGQEVKMKLEDGCYYDGIIKEIETENEETVYSIRSIDEEMVKRYSMSDLCLTESQRYNIQPVGLIPKGSPEKAKKPRKRAVRSMISTTSESEVIIKPERKRRRTTMQNVKLFTDISFLITEDNHPDPYGLGTASEESEEEEDCLMDMDKIMKLIKDNDGRILGTINKREIQRAKRVICIARKPEITNMYLYCVATGIPILHYTWLYDSVEKSTRLDYWKYKLPAGKDITGDDVNQNYTEYPRNKRDPYTPLVALKIYFHIGKWENNSKELNILLRQTGCERMYEQIHVGRKTKKITFDLGNVHYICTLASKIPSVLWRAAQEHNVTVVTCDWLIQCLINNELLDVADSTKFTYRHHKSPSASENNSSESK